MHAQEAIRLIRRQADRLRTLDANDSRQPVFRRWFRDTKAVLEEAFGSAGGPNREFQDVLFQPLRPSKVDPDSDWRQAYEKGVSVAFSFLDSVIEDLNKHPDHVAAEAPVEKTRDQGATSTPGTPSAGASTAKLAATRRACLVVGSDEEACGEVVRFLEKIGSRAISSCASPGSAASILDALDEHADVAFAVMLLAAEETDGGARARTAKTTRRAGRNTSLELGILLGRLGRKNICMLHREGAEAPPDSEGIACVALDTRGAWRFDLARAMKGAGVPVDLNNAV